MLELSVKASAVGVDYLNQLEEVVGIRKNRREIYGDSFLDEKKESIINIIDGKKRRFETILQKQTKSDIDKSKLLDELRDIVNYYIFLCCIIEAENENSV